MNKQPTETELLRLRQWELLKAAMNSIRICHESLLHTGDALPIDMETLNSLVHTLATTAKNATQPPPSSI